MKFQNGRNNIITKGSDRVKVINMGGSSSKQFPLTYDEASKRGKISCFLHFLSNKCNSKFQLEHYNLKSFLVTEVEKRRLQDAFRRSSAANNNLSKQVRDDL